VQLRTDLALENREFVGDKLPKGVTEDFYNYGDTKITKIEILDKNGEKALGKPIGKYITVEMAPFYKSAESDQKIEAVAKELCTIIPEEGSALVVGLGNTEITPDSLGPLTASQVLATRHIKGEIARSTGLEGMRPVSVLFPGVLGQTGMETREILFAVKKEIKPDFIIAVDAMASRSVSRLGCTVQMSNTGIIPGSGVGNSRPRICTETIGVPVISIGIPTVVNSSVLFYDTALSSGLGYDDAEKIYQKSENTLENMTVTPREIDLLIQRASRLLSLALNTALHREFSVRDFQMLLS